MRYKYLNHILFLISFQSCLLFGQRQPEQYAFESSNMTDLVDLATGDFTYGLPLISLPASGGEFSMPISYHAGISLEEEASWVGLGWSVNPGLITRDVIGVPDDSKMQQFKEKIYDPGMHGFIIYYLGFAAKTYDTERGYGMIYNLGPTKTGTGSQKGMSFRGLSIEDGKIVEDSPGAFKESFYGDLISLALITTGTPTGKGLGSSLARSAYSQGSRPTQPPIIVDRNMYTVETNQKFFKDSYEITIDTTFISWASGALYSGGGTLFTGVNPRQHFPPTVSLYEVDEGTFIPADKLQRVAEPEESNVRRFSRLTNYTGGYDKLLRHDVHVNEFNVEKGSYSGIKQPVSVAFDNYVVMADGASGSITPYRPEVCNVARNSYSHFGPCDLHFQDDYPGRINFRYVNELGNNYLYTDCDPGLTIDANPTSNNFKYNLTGDQIQNDSLKLIESNRSGLQDGVLQFGRHIVYHTNAEISSGTFSGLMDFLPPEQRAAFRDGNYTTEAYIGGFAVTNEKGYTYHFSIPVYNLGEVDYSHDAKTGVKVEKSHGGYVNSWLLTGITGPDFIDMDQNNYISDNDYGYWVKFEYSHVNNIRYRYPYMNEYYTANDINDQVIKEGVRTQYYLKSIITNTHIAAFVTGMRNDGRGKRTVTTGTVSDVIGYSLKLDDIYIFRKNDFVDLQGLGFVENASNYYDTETINLLGSEIGKRMISRLHFEYSYDLCKNYPGSFTCNYTISGVDPSLLHCTNIDPAIGKLTLKSIQRFGRNNVSATPPYTFEYYENDPVSNPDYSRHNFDGWGYYSAAGIYSIGSHFGTSDGDQWSLREIKTPVGENIQIEYERDIYNSVSGFPVWSDKLKFTLGRGDNSVEDVDYSAQEIEISLGSLCRKLSRYMYHTGITNHIFDGGIYRKINGEEVCISPQTVRFESNVVKMDFDDSDFPNTFDDWDSISGEFSLNTDLLPDEVFGGGLRVKKLTITDNLGEAYSTNYNYNDPVSGKSSGAVTSEPDYCRATSSFYDLNVHDELDFPANKLLYEHVSIENHLGNITNYTFDNPDCNYITLSRDRFDLESPFPSNKGYRLNNFMSIEVDIMSSKLGRIQTQESFNRAGDRISAIYYDYYDPEDLLGLGNSGIFTQGTILGSIQKHVVGPAGIFFLEESPIG